MQQTGDAAGFWREMLLAGSGTVLPPWSEEPAAETGEHHVELSEDLYAAVEQVADGLALPVAAVLLAVHAKVLASLTGETEVTAGYAPSGDGRVLPCRLSTAATSWRALLEDTGRVQSRVHRHQDHPVDDLARRLHVAARPFETVVDAVPRDDEQQLPEGTALRLWLGRRDGHPVLWLHHRTDAVDAAHAARIAGYHVTALQQLADDPEAGHATHTLLSADELDLQLNRLGGPRRALPDRRVHELFEAQVTSRPDAVAAVLGGQRWTYRELDARANQLARALLSRGLGREGVVAVVTERNLDWLATVLAILKAGGVYLPVEPHFPPDRIATTLARAGCRLAVTERASTTMLDRALASLPGVQRLLVEDAYAESHDDSPPGVEVAADQLAYIYFTSGSTGEPKGAMCEHAGMLNHLLAKIDDLEIGAGSVVAQTAPQCFDISLWQLVAALLVGGRTLIIEQQVVLDAHRMVETLERERVGVLQVVPSYLEVVLSSLDQQPRSLPDLRFVSVTGEALKRELAERWFAAQPGIRLVNAYGLTETSDDTNHEVMDRAPAGDRVPLGRCVPNVRVYVVDDQLTPVPLGAPGLIVFSGVCVGRGYVNDPERTREAYLEDPHHPGERLYRGGDYGRWRPGGTLEFLGRRDGQVKIAGFRIEIGEIENRLLRVPGVRDAAVVVVEASDRSRHLVGFYSADHPVPDKTVHDRLAESLPSYMVPATSHWRASLPLTPNGKIDRTALTALAAELGANEASGAGHRSPRTPAERTVAAAWARVLGVQPDAVGRDDHFFDRGGTSLSAVKLVVALERRVSLRDVTRHPVLADLAALLDSDRPAAVSARHDPTGERHDVRVPDIRA